MENSSIIRHTIPEFGFTMDLDQNEYIDKAIYKNHFEPVTKKWISTHLSAGNAFIDVGANIGFFTLLAASKVGEHGRIIAVEPTTFAMAKLQANLALNSYKNVSVFKYALSNSRRYAVDITYSPDQYYQETDHSLRSSWRMDNNTVGSVQTGQKDFCDHIPLDDLCTREEYERVNMIKIDVDGNELNVLAGARKTIEQYRPLLIVELLDPSRSKTRFQTQKGLDDLQDRLDFIFGQNYEAESESGKALQNTGEMISFLKEFDGKSGAPNFLFTPS